MKDHGKEEAIKPVKTLRQTAYERFMAGLFDRKIAPGAFVTQKELSDVLDVPIGPVREALKRLEAEGLVNLRAQRGVQIRHVDQELMRETFGVRSMIEIRALEIYIQTANESEIDALIGMTGDMARILAQGHVSEEISEEVKHIDRKMHDSFVAKTENSIIIDFYASNFAKIRLTRLNGVHLPERSAEIMQEHLDVLHAVKARDFPRARHALETHLDISQMRALGFTSSGGRYGNI